MSEPSTITTEIDEVTLASLQLMAARRGTSVEQIAGEAIRQVADDDRNLSAAIAEGRRQIANGEGLTHDELVAELGLWRRDRKHAA